MAKKNHVDPATLVIERWGGIRTLALDLGIEPSSVMRWRDRRIVPSKWMATLLTIASEQGIPLTASELILGGEV